MNAIERPQATRKSVSRSLCALLLGAVVAAAVVAVAPATGTNATKIGMSICSGPAIVAVDVGQRAVEEVAVDLSASTTGSALRSLYTTAARAIVARAVTESALLRVVAFGPSGVGAQPVFQASFAAVGDDELFNLAASNRLRCLAQQQIATLAVFNGAGRDRGTDVAGMLRSLIENARSVTTDGARMTVTIMTDGCQAPATTGLNRGLTDVCGKLAAGKTIDAILAAHEVEFSLPDASGVTVVMRGVGVGRRPAAASTRLAATLIEFWMTVCRRAHAKACLVGSDLP
jgi:hypothetical protein